MEDNELINAVIDGSVEQYAVLIDRYQNKLQSALGFYCRNRQDVQYFLHESFVCAYTKLSSFDQSYSFYPWLKVIAVNLLRQEIRKNKSLSARAIQYMELKLIEEEAQTDNFKLEVLNDCMGELEEGQMEILKKRYWAKQSIKDVSAALNRSPDALKMQIKRIRESLKKCIKFKLEVDRAKG